MLLGDFGTSYCKILDTGADASPRLVATRDLDRTFCADLAPGHNAARRSPPRINGLYAPAPGGDGPGRALPDGEHHAGRHRVLGPWQLRRDQPLVLGASA